MDAHVNNSNTRRASQVLPLYEGVKQQNQQHHQNGQQQGRRRSDRRLIQMVALLAVCIVAAFLFGIVAGSHFVHTNKGSGEGLYQQHLLHHQSRDETISSTGTGAGSTSDDADAKGDHPVAGSGSVHDDQAQQVPQQRQHPQAAAGHTLTDKAGTMMQQQPQRHNEGGDDGAAAAPAAGGRVEPGTGAGGDAQLHVPAAAAGAGLSKGLELEHSLRAVAGLHVVMTNSLSATPEVASMAWVYLLPPRARSNTDRRTILSNKPQGCVWAGYSLYVDGEGRIGVEYVTAAAMQPGWEGSACKRHLSSNKVPAEQWFHVSVVFTPDHLVVYLNASPVIEVLAATDRLYETRQQRMHVGAAPLGADPLHGHVAQALFLSGSLSQLHVLHMMVATMQQTLQALLSNAPDASASLGEWDKGALLAALPLTGANLGVNAADARLQLEVLTKGPGFGGALTARLALPQAQAQADHAQGEDGGAAEAVQQLVGGVPAKDDGQQALPSPPPVGEGGGAAAGVDVHYVDGSWEPQLLNQEERAEGERVAQQRADAVRAAMKHAWKGYRQYAWGKDELRPNTAKGENNWGGIGMTLVDSLDTLWLMGLTDEFVEAREWVSSKLRFDTVKNINVFEITIRELAGLLAAYDLSDDKVFLDKAKDLGDRLLPAFNTRSGLPVNGVDLSTKTAQRAGTVTLAEFGTLQVEFRYLSHVLGDPKYAEAANKVFDTLSALHPPDDLYPISFSANSGAIVRHTVTVGALGDSFYEYLLKVWIQGGRSEGLYRDMYDKAIDGMVKHMVKKTEPSGLLYFAEWDGMRHKTRMDHLACFMGGALALGAHTCTDPERAKRDLRMAKAFSYTCHLMYKLQPTGLSPENADFGRRPLRHVRVGSESPDFQPAVRTYQLRPEVAETFFVLHQLTGDPIYREWSWEIFEAIERNCKVGVGYGSYKDVTNTRAGVEDSMQSFFLAETLKYLYLIQVTDQPIDLDTYVLNTEAHPLRAFGLDSVAVSQHAAAAR